MSRKARREKCNNPSPPQAGRRDLLAGLWRRATALWAMPADNGANPGRSRSGKGHDAEDHAALYLKRQGWEVLDRNCRLGTGELDIVARRDGCIAVVEVKSGCADEAFRPADHLNAGKQRQLVRLTGQWMKKRGLLGSEVRIDLVEVIFRQGVREPEIIHHEGAVTVADRWSSRR